MLFLVGCKHGPNPNPVTVHPRHMLVETHFYRESSFRNTIRKHSGGYLLARHCVANGMLRASTKIYNNCAVADKKQLGISFPVRPNSVFVRGCPSLHRHFPGKDARSFRIGVSQGWGKRGRSSDQRDTCLQLILVPRRARQMFFPTIIVSL